MNKEATSYRLSPAAIVFIERLAEGLGVSCTSVVEMAVRKIGANALTANILAANSIIDGKITDSAVDGPPGSCNRAAGPGKVGCKMSRIWIGLLLTVACISSLSATVISGQVTKLLGKELVKSKNGNSIWVDRSPGAEVSVRFELQNCVYDEPVLLGSSSISVPNTKTFAPNPDGSIDGSVTGNDIIFCHGAVLRECERCLVTRQTYYKVQILYKGQLIVSRDCYIAGPSWDIATASQVWNDPGRFLTFADQQAAAEEARQLEAARAACKVIYKRTIDKKAQDLTIRETELVHACQGLDLYPPKELEQ